MIRKYFTEFGLDVYTSYKTLIPIESLEKLEKIDKRKYHIYFILSYPNFFIKKEKTFVTNEGIQIVLFNIENNIEVEYKLPLCKINNAIYYSKIKLSCVFPYSNLKIEIKDDKFLKKHPDYKKELNISAQMFFSLYANLLKDVCKYEVLYIGQSYGKRGERSAFNRLSAHSTLQKILVDYQEKYLNKHIYILLLEMTPILDTDFDGISKKYSESD